MMMIHRVDMWLMLYKDIQQETSDGQSIEQFTSIGTRVLWHEKAVQSSRWANIYR